MGSRRRVSGKGTQEPPPVSPSPTLWRQEANPRRAEPCGDPHAACELRVGPRVPLRPPQEQLRPTPPPQVLFRNPKASAPAEYPSLPNPESLGPRGRTRGLPSSPRKGLRVSLTRWGRGGCRGARGARGSPKVESHIAGAEDQSGAPATLGALLFLIRRGNCPSHTEFRLFPGLAYEA